MNYRYICEYKIDGKWQKDGEAMPTLEDATTFAMDNYKGFGWDFRIRRFPLSAGKLVEPSKKELARWHDKAEKTR